MKRLLVSLTLLSALTFAETSPAAASTTSCGVTHTKKVVKKAVRHTAAKKATVRKASAKVMSQNDAPTCSSGAATSAVVPGSGDYLLSVPAGPSINTHVYSPTYLPSNGLAELGMTGTVLPTDTTMFFDMGSRSLRGIGSETYAVTTPVMSPRAMLARSFHVNTSQNSATPYYYNYRAGNVRATFGGFSQAELPAGRAATLVTGGTRVDDDAMTSTGMPKGYDETATAGISPRPGSLPNSFGASQKSR
jgi:hypothetical protein